MPLNSHLDPFRPVLSPSKIRTNASRFDSCMSTDTDDWKRTPSSSFVTDVDQENMPPSRYGGTQPGGPQDVKASPAWNPSPGAETRSSPPSKPSQAADEFEVDWNNHSLITSPNQITGQTRMSASTVTEKRPLEPEQDSASFAYTPKLSSDRSSSQSQSSRSSDSVTKRVKYNPSSGSRASEASSRSTPRLEAEADPKSDEMSSSNVHDPSSMLESTIVMSTDNTELGFDDSCLSTFSAIPNAEMTRYSKVNPTPSKLIGSIRSRIAQDRNTLVSRSARARRQVEHPSSRSPTKGAPEPPLLTRLNQERRAGYSQPVPATPSRNSLLNLLDFDLPPAPTPKSVPTITVRELETLKSEYLSQISSLKASLSGREAEVTSLKGAVVDAERRVGEAHELLREERSAREHAEKENKAWEQRHLDLKEALDGVKEEYMQNEKDREDLQARLEKLERRAEAAEERAEAAEKRAAEAASKAATAPASCSDTGAPLYTAEQVQTQIDSKIQALSTELHSIYKKKHVTKVAGLRKTYEDKLVRTTTDLQHKISSLKAQLAELQKNSTSSSAGAEQLLDLQERYRDIQKRYENQKAELETQRAMVAGLGEEIKSMQDSNAALMSELENERVEKGELVAAVDEMLALQAEITGGGGGGPSALANDDTPPSSATSVDTPSLGDASSQDPSHLGTVFRPHGQNPSVADLKLSRPSALAAPSSRPGIGNPSKLRSVAGAPVFRRV